MATIFNVFSPFPGGSPVTTSYGRTWSGPLAVMDRNSSEGSELQSRGWLKLADHTGTTANRITVDPLFGPISSGFRYLDTTLNKVVVWSGGGWIDANTGIAA